MPVLLIGAGLFSIICSVKGYRFFWEHRRAQLMVRILGLTGTKVFYITLGLALVVIGIGMAVVGLPADAGPIFSDSPVAP